MREFPIVPRFDDQGKFIYIIEYRVGADITMRLRARHYTEGMLYGEWTDYIDIGTQVVDDAPAPNITAVASVGGYALNNNDASSVISDNKVVSAKIRQVELDSSMAEIADTVVEYSWLFIGQPFIQQGLRQGVIYSLSVNYVNVLGADGAATALQVETLSLSDVISVDRGIDFTAPAAALDLMVGVAIPAPGITLPAAMVNFGGDSVSQDFMLGADPFTSSGNSRTWDGALLIDSTLVEGGGEAWIRFIRVNTGNNTIMLRLSATETGSASGAGPEFINSVEVAAIFAMFTEAGGDVFSLAGPDAPGNDSPDATEPYGWIVSAAIADAFVAWIDGLGSGEVVLTISSAMDSVAIQYGTEGTVSSGLIIDTNTRIVTGQVDAAGYSVFGWTASAGGAFSAVPIHVNVLGSTDASFIFGDPSIPRLVRGAVIAADSFRLPTALRMGMAISDPTYSVESGLPTGIAFDGATRYVSGTPTSSGNFSLLYKVVDNSDSTEAFVRYEFSIEEPFEVSPFLFDNPIIPRLVRGAVIAADSFRLPIATKRGLSISDPTYSVESGLPTGIAFDGATRYVSGTPTSSGNFSLLYKVADNSDSTEDFVRYEFSIETGAPPMPTGVDNRAPEADSVTIFWTSSGDFFTEIIWEIDNSDDPMVLIWIPKGNSTTYAQEYTIEDLLPGRIYRYRVRHRNINSGTPGPWYIS